MSQGARDRWVMGGGTTVLVMVGTTMLVRFHDADSVAWNVFPVLFVTGLVTAAFFLQRYLREHINDVGEARFDTWNKQNG